MQHIADIISFARIAAAVALLFPSPMSLPFFVFYTIGGVSDAVDGAVARKLGTAGEFGARLDSIADLVFLLSAAVRLLPELWVLLPAHALWAAAAIAVIKCVTAAFGAVKFRRLCFLHTYMNKLTGALIFLLPYFFRIGCFVVLVYAVCGIAFLAAAEELICAVRMKEYNAEARGLFI